MEQLTLDKLPAPTWLNDQFFLEVIRKAQNDPSITLCHGCKLRPDTDMYPRNQSGCNIFRTAVHYRSNRFHNERAISLIMKTIIETQRCQKEALKNDSLFDTEIKMYSEVLPEMSKLLKEAGEHLEVPRLIHAAIKPQPIIILEDISSKGWQPGREIVTSFEEALYTIRNIAKFHAASFFLHQTSMDLSTFQDQVYVKESIESNENLHKRFNEFCDAVQTWDGCDHIASKCNALKDVMAKKLQQVYSANPKGVGYNVLNHAGLHWKNLLHKKTANARIKGSMMIGYQCCNWGSPAVDVLCLLDVVVDHKTKKIYRKEVIYEYYQHFVEILNKLGFLGSVPTLTDLHVELLRRGILEVFHVAMFTEEIYSGQLNNPDSDDLRTELASLMYKGVLD